MSVHFIDADGLEYVRVSGALTASGGGGLTDAELRALPVDVYDSLRNSSFEKVALPFTVTTVGAPFVHTPAAGKAIRLYWITANVDPSGGVFPRVSVVLPTAADPTREIYRVRGALSHTEFFQGDADATLTVSISANATVDGTAHIEEVTP